MSKKTVKYSDGEIGAYKLVDDFLPPPHELVKKEETVKVKKKYLGFSSNKKLQ